jgi:hypothetical protein
VVQGIVCWEVGRQGGGGGAEGSKMTGFRFTASPVMVLNKSEKVEKVAKLF